MNPESFDAITRIAARRSNRRSILKAAALGMAATAPISFRRAEAASDDAAAVVQSFYANIDAYQYEQAYALVGAKWHSEQSLDTFTKGYANTAFVQCSVTGKEASGANTAVSVHLVSWHNDGNIVTYQGNYTVGSENGALLILAGDNTPVRTSPATAPLCKVGDLSFTFGTWDAGAGNRFSSIVATNGGAKPCALGGSPRVELTDAANHTVRSTSDVAASPTAIVVKPGDTASAPLDFANWCGETSEPKSIKIDLPGAPATGSVKPGENGISYPPCLGKSEPAKLSIKGWTAAGQ